MHKLADFCGRRLIHQRDAWNQKQFVMQGAPADLDHARFDVSSVKDIKCRLQLFVVRFRETSACDLAVEGEGQRDLRARMVGKSVWPNLLKFGGDRPVFLVLPIRDAVPVNHPLEILLLAPMHGLPGPAADHLVSAHQRGISRLADRSGNRSVGGELGTPEWVRALKLDPCDPEERLLNAASRLM